MFAALAGSFPEFDEWRKLELPSGLLNWKILDDLCQKLIGNRMHRKQTGFLDVYNGEHLREELWELKSWQRNDGGGILGEESWRRNLGRGILGEGILESWRNFGGILGASWRRKLGRGIMKRES